MSDLSSRAAPEAPAPPAVVAERFADRLPELMRYAGLLAGPGTVRGLLGPREIPRLWDRHLLNSLALAELLPEGVRLVDIGTGAGLPGLAVAIVRPDLRVDLVESLLRRTVFLEEAVAELGLTGQVRVVRGRAEEPAVVKQVGAADYVTARAVAPLDRLVTWSRGLLRAGGTLLALKGVSAEQELAEHHAVLRRLRFQVDGVVECGSGLVEPPTRVVRLVRE